MPFKRIGFFLIMISQLFFFWGDLQERKIHLLIETISNLKEKGFIFNLLIIGGGEEIESLKKKIRKTYRPKNLSFYWPCFQ